MSWAEGDLPGSPCQCTACREGAQLRVGVVTCQQLGCHLLYNFCQTAVQSVSIVGPLVAQARLNA